jgi:hypothetical protein
MRVRKHRLANVFQSLQKLNEFTKILPRMWPPWRRNFFSNWREVTKVVYAQCMQCNGKRFFSSSKLAFISYSIHYPRIYCKEWNKFITSGTVKKSFRLAFHCLLLCVVKKKSAWHWDSILQTSKIYNPSYVNLVNEQNKIRYTKIYTKQCVICIFLYFCVFL